MNLLQKLLLSLAVLSAAALSGQSETMWRQLFAAEELISAAKCDSAITTLDNLDASLACDDPEPWERNFRLLIRLKECNALVRARRFGEATEALLHLIDDAQRLQRNSILAEAYIRLAFIHQHQHQPEECRDLLQQADSLIQQHGIRSLVPLLNNRIAGYHRYFGDMDEVEKHARTALTSAEEQNNAHQVALAHFNLSFYYRSTDLQASQRHLEEATDYYYHTGSMGDYFAMTLVLTGLKIESGNMEEALAANDSSLVYAAMVIEKDSTYLNRLYDYRATILKELGQTDSAWHYLKLAHAAELDHVDRMNQQNAVAIEERYDSEKKSLLIAEQSKMLAYERSRVARVILIFVLVVVILVLAYLVTNRVRRSRAALEQQQLTEEKNQQLSESLAQQKLLQGEVHHRVKNNLQIIISLLQMQMKKLNDPVARGQLDAMAGRVYSMAAVHEILYQQGRVGEINFRTYAQKICQHFEMLSELPHASEFDLDVGNHWFNLETAIPLGTMFNELLTNSFKYAVVSGQQLRISVKLTETDDGMFLLEYQDNGPGFSAPSGQQEEGLGSYLIRGMSRQLRGRLEISNQNGANTRIWFRRKNDPAETPKKKRKTRTLVATTTA
ncbi:two-component sensor histidine kinase [Lewinella marina]|uniref:sensor histidine kinase n=1 Tax=Neolewinella marina TaxID=438751 RepID=UPI00143073EB|nr:sensor histidine kinase [Neolewinella marina]NJB86868.1 two-component sensor histidine kinase [Neolewinella marina]